MSKIYKYTKLEYTKRILETNSIKVSHPRELNDPYDCDIHIGRDAIDKSIVTISEYVLEDSLYKELNKNGVNLKLSIKLMLAILKLQRYGNIFAKYYNSNPSITAIAKILLGYGYNQGTINKQDINDDFNKNILSKIYDLKDKTLIGCFSKRPDSILMWSHYADSHKGVCIEFERPDDCFIDIRYSKNRKAFNLDYAIRLVLGNALAGCDINSNDLKIIKKLLAPYFTKYSDWKYEKEVRCINLETDDVVYKEGDYYFAKINAPIKKLYIGCCAEKEKLQPVLDIAKEQNIEVVFCKANPDSYRIE